METIRKTVESKYAPKQTNVIWVDTSGDTPVEKHFIKGKWIAVGGGGGTNVEANPEGEYPTAIELHSLRIDEQVYAVPEPQTPDAQLSDTSTNAVQNKVVKAALDVKAPASNIQKAALASDVQTSLGKADTAYQKPQTGIPESDLSSDVQQALQKHFKGWYDSSSNLPDNPHVGDYAYVKGAETTDPAAIYECTTAGSWSNSGRTADTTNVQTFASSQEVNETYIDDTHLANPVAGSLAKAEDAAKLQQMLIGDDISVDIQVTRELTTNAISVGNGRYINGSNLWKGRTFPEQVTKVAAVSPGDSVHMTYAYGGRNNLYACVLKSFDYTDNTPDTNTSADVSTASGFTAPFLIKSKPDFVVPADGKYLFWWANYYIQGEEAHDGEVTIQASTTIHKSKGVYAEIEELDNEVSQDISAIEDSLQEIESFIYEDGETEIALGSLYHGSVVTDNVYTCLSNTVYFRVKPSSTIKLFYNTGITLRVAEYSKTKSYIGDSGSYTAMTEYTVGNNTEYVRIAAYYSGYSSSNPITLADYTDGDFGIKLSIDSILDNMQQQIDSVEGNGIITKNKDKLERIEAVSHTRNKTTKDLAFAINTDAHGNTTCLDNVIELVDGVADLDAVMILGDMLTNNYVESEVNAWQTAFSKGTKPKYAILGNHDVGNTNKVRFSCTNAQAYNAFIKPIVDAGFLENGEYEVGKCYYYHDFTTHNVRVIFINDFDETLELADSDYWEAVTYDSSKPKMVNNTSYSVGDIVNCGIYTDYSFRCKADCTSGTSSVAGQEPTYKMTRGYRVIGASQAQWLLDTLCSTPENYSVIIATHVLFSNNATPQPSLKFCMDGSRTASSSQNYMQTDFIADAVNAFANGTNYSANVAMKSEAAYMNTEGSGTYAYSVSKDFSTKNNNVNFIGFIGGHFHQDIVWQHDAYTTQRSITPMSSKPNVYEAYKADVVRSTNEDDVSYDAVTIVGVDTKNGKLKAARIGADVSTDMYLRDIEVIS